MAPSGSASSRPAIHLAHLRGAGRQELESHVARIERERAASDAEAFHRKVVGVAEPTSLHGRRYLAEKYPMEYPQWSHLVERKELGKTVGSHKTAGISVPNITARRQQDRHGGRGSQGPTTTRNGRGYGSKQLGQGSVPRLQPNAPPRTSFKPQGQQAPPALPDRGNQMGHGRGRVQHSEKLHQSELMRNGTRFGTPQSQSSPQVKTWEEWRAAEDQRERKQKEENAAMLLEDNMRAMQVELPSDTQSLSSRSISTEPKSDRFAPLPHYGLLQPIRKAPSSDSSSYGISSANAIPVPNSTPSFPTIQPVRTNEAELKEVMQSSPVSFSSEDHGAAALIPGIPTFSAFRAPDWRARGEPEWQPDDLDGVSEILSAESGTGNTTSVEEITAEWERALLASD